MGLETFDPELWRRLENLLESSNVDYDIFGVSFRKFRSILTIYRCLKSSANDAAALLKTFSPCVLRTTGRRRRKWDRVDRRLDTSSKDLRREANGHFRGDETHESEIRSTRMDARRGVHRLVQKRRRFACA